MSTNSKEEQFFEHLKKVLKRTTKTFLYLEDELEIDVILFFHSCLPKATETGGVIWRAVLCAAPGPGDLLRRSLTGLSIDSHSVSGYLSDLVQDSFQAPFVETRRKSLNDTTTLSCIFTVTSKAKLDAVEALFDCLYSFFYLKCLNIH